MFWMMPPDEPPPNPKKPEPPPLKTLVGEKAGAFTPSDTVETAARRMRALDTDTWPVAEDRTLVGAIDDKNPDQKIARFGHDPRTWRVGEIMNPHVIFCYEDEDCDAAHRLMIEHDLDYLPVVDRQMRIVGIFNRKELARKVEETRLAQEPATLETRPPAS